MDALFRFSSRRSKRWRRLRKPSKRVYVPRPVKSAVAEGLAWRNMAPTLWCAWLGRPFVPVAGAPRPVIWACYIDAIVKCWIFVRIATLSCTLPARVSQTRAPSACVLAQLDRGVAPISAVSAWGSGLALSGPPPGPPAHWTGVAASTGAPRAGTGGHGMRSCPGYLHSCRSHWSFLCST
jgi:hypothetical protein